MNPILQMLNNPNQNNLLSQINQIKQMLSGGDPDAMFNQLVKSNPQFAQFVRQNRGKSVEQIASENNIDLSAIKKLI